MRISMYDIKAGYVETPDGIGRYVSHKTGVVTVEMDDTYLIDYEADKCFLKGGVCNG